LRFSCPISLYQVMRGAVKPLAIHYLLFTISRV
jgi:hypothetical protein